MTGSESSNELERRPWCMLGGGPLLAKVVGEVFGRVVRQGVHTCGRMCGRMRGRMRGRRPAIVAAVAPARPAAVRRTLATHHKQILHRKLFVRVNFTRLRRYYNLLKTITYIKRVYSLLCPS